MPTHTVICAGGSGARVLEALVHLCAAGAFEGNLRAFVIDPDDNNGNVTQARELVRSYRQCRALVAGAGPGFQPEIDVICGDELQVWSPAEGKPSFDELLNYTQLGDRAKDAVHLLFSKLEVGMGLTRGFNAHPALGAAAFALVPDAPADELWRRLAERLNSELGQEPLVKVAITGSVFGGTGAAAFYPAVRYLRRLQHDGHPLVNPARLRVAAIALAPYFQFARVGDAGPDAVARPENFAIAARAAAQFYEHVHAQAAETGLDAMYWIGFDPPRAVPFNQFGGGPDQRNPADLADFLSALAVLDFCASQDQRDGPPRFRYAGPGLGAAPPYTWTHLPDNGQSRRRMDRFHVAALAHLGFFKDLYGAPEPGGAPPLSTRPWLLPHHYAALAVMGEDGRHETLDALTAYFGAYLRWVDELHESSTTPARARLFNPLAWRPDSAKGPMPRLDYLLAQPGAAPDRSAMNRLLDAMARAKFERQDVAKDYWAALTAAANRLVEKRERGLKDRRNAILSE